MRSVFFTSYEIPVEHSTQDEAGHVRVSCVYGMSTMYREVYVCACVCCVLPQLHVQYLCIYMFWMHPRHVDYKGHWNGVSNYCYDMYLYSQMVWQCFGD